MSGLTSRVSRGAARRVEWLDPLLARASEMSASDVHIVTGECPRLRVAGELETLEDMRPLEAEDLRALLIEIVPPDRRRDLDDGREVDFSYGLSGSRFRVSAFRERRGPSVAFRRISARPPALLDMGLQRDLARAVYFPTGLVLVAGHAGAGKTTTLASILQEFCAERVGHLITLEDPIEYRLDPQRAYVEQRELGKHFKSFQAGVREAIEAAPDAIAIGELRDTETIRLALQAAETGILVLATVHAYDTIRTVGRVVDSFPFDDRAAARVALAGTVRMVIAQTLLRRARGPGRVPAVEVCLGSTSLDTLIREGKDQQITTLLESSRGRGMRTLDDSIVELARSGQVSKEEAIFFAVNKESVQKQLEA